VPVAGSECGEGPFHALDGEASLYVFVLRDVLAVIAIDEIIEEGTAIYNKADGGQEKTDQ